MTKPCCPYCRSTNLRLIGGLLISPKGAPFEEGLTLQNLEPSDVHITRPYLRCAECKKEFKVDEARKAAGEDVSQAMWEVTEQGVRIPVVCPKCGNHEHFVRTVIELVRKDEDVLVEGGVPVVQFVGGDVVVDHRASLSYTCGVEECSGVVHLFTNDFHIVHAT